MSGNPKVLIYDVQLHRFSPLLERFGVAHLWDHDDPIAFATGEGKSIEAMLCISRFPLDRELIAAFPNLKLIHCIGSGFEGVPLDLCKSRGIAVTNAAGVNAEDVADVAMALLLAVQMETLPNHAKVIEGHWIDGTPPSIRRSMIGLRVGIVGLGAIGHAIAKRLEGFGCKITWWGPRDKPGVTYTRASSILALAKQNDVLMIAARADSSNAKLISKEIIHTLGPEGIIVNISRGSIVDEHALVEALINGTLGGAGLDVFEEEPTPADRWKNVPNVVLSPHTAGAGLYSIQRYQEIFLTNFENILSGKPVINPVY